MTLTKEQIKIEVDHIFESGANEIRVIELIERLLPRWIPIGERLPEISMAKETKSKIKFVEVLVSDGVSVFTDNYLFETAGFVQYGKDVKFWMLRPEPPKK